MVASYLLAIWQSGWPLPCCKGVRRALQQMMASWPLGLRTDLAYLLVCKAPCLQGL